MTREERLAILGPDDVASARQRAAAAPPPSPELCATLRPILAPAMARVLAAEEAAATPPLAA